jgi:hypothetical protein
MLSFNKMMQEEREERGTFFFFFSQDKNPTLNTHIHTIYMRARGIEPTPN